MRTTYNLRGPAELMENGRGPSQSDSDWSNSFVVLEAQRIGYEPATGRRASAALLSAMGETLAVAQVNYDAAGNVRCTAKRMNPAEFAALPVRLGIIGSTCSPPRESKAPELAAWLSGETVMYGIHPIIIGDL